MHTLPDILLLFVLFLCSLAVKTAHAIPACDEFLTYNNVENLKKPDIPFKKGLLWKIAKNDKINYLYGTIHSQDYAVSQLPAPVKIALGQSKLLLIETIPDQAASDTFADMIYFQDTQQLEQFLEPEFIQKLADIIVNYGVAKERVNNLKPWSAFSLIGRPRPGYAPTLESELLKFARQHTLETQSLESMGEILSMLDTLSMHDQITILKDTICNHTNIILSTKTLIDLYLDRDLAGIVAFNWQPHHDEQVFERLMQNILYERNERMLRRIIHAFEKGDVFVAVGALHLAEEKGLLNQLAKLDYKVSAIY